MERTAGVRAASMVNTVTCMSPPTIAQRLNDSGWTKPSKVTRTSSAPGPCYPINA